MGRVTFGYGVFLACVLLLGFVSSGLSAMDLANGAPLVGSFQAWPPDTDAWGYTWKDSDKNPGEIVYSWREISGVGVEVLGLADDNGFGPFPVGFDFPYYWYTSDVFYLGSNGYISLTDPVVQSATFPNIPSQGRPNGTIAAMMSDLLFPGDSAHCYYWTNAALDTCIVEYKNVPFWDRSLGWNGLNTFEIILAKWDSSITFQYAYHDKGTYDYVGENMTVGIEDRTGDWGLSYQFANSASGDSLHAELAIKFKDWAIEPDPPVYDLASLEVMRPETKGFFLIQPESVRVWGKIGNIGSQTLVSYRAIGKVEKNRGALGWTPVWGDTADITVPIVPGQVDSITFDNPWFCNEAAEFRLMVACTSAQDNRPADNGTSNADKADCHAVTLNDSARALLTYDNAGTLPPTSILFGAETGLCNKYTPSSYPAYLCGFAANLTGTMDSVVMALWDDDGPNGYPGTVIFQDTIAPQSGLNEETLNPLDYRVDLGSVYAGIWVLSEGGPALVENTNNPFSRQGWELLGGGASGFREMFSGDLSTSLTIQAPLVAVEIRCLTPVVPQGGRLRYEVTLANNTSQRRAFFYWARARLPDGTWYGEYVVPPTAGRLSPKQTKTFPVSQTVPRFAPLGQYEYWGYVGPDTTLSWDEDWFNFTVTAQEGMTASESRKGLPADDPYCWNSDLLENAMKGVAANSRRD